MVRTVVISQTPKLTQPFLRALKDVFRILLQSDCRVLSSECLEKQKHPYEIVSEIELTGDLEGRILLSTSLDGAGRILQRMTGLEPSEMEECIPDALGEVTNMVAGGGKRRLDEYHLQMGLPNVFLRKDAKESVRPSSSFDWVSFQTDICTCLLGVDFGSPT